MAQVHRWAFVALLTLGIADGARAAAPIAAENDYSYLAVIAGACDQLVVDDRTVTTCADKLVNVDFGNGRVAFMFISGRDGGTTVVTTFSGGASEQRSARDYHLMVDRVATTTTTASGSTPPTTVVVAAAGTCTMRGDPTHEQTRFECRAESAGKETLGRFRSRGAPIVHAGARRAGSDADRAENDPASASSPIAAR